MLVSKATMPGIVWRKVGRYHSSTDWRNGKTHGVNYANLNSTTYSISVRYIPFASSVNTCTLPEKKVIVEYSRFFGHYQTLT